MPSLLGLVADESYAGCCMVVIAGDADINIETDTVCRVQVGKLLPMKARVVWCKILDAKLKVYKVGFQYLE
jgi:hypothetical protein